MVERLDGLGALFVYIQTPTSPMHVSGVLIVDPATATGAVTVNDVLLSARWTV